MGLCGAASPTEVSDECIRITWATFLPVGVTALVFLFTLPRLVLPASSRVFAFWRRLTRPLRTLISLEDALALQNVDIKDSANGSTSRDAETLNMLDATPPRWRTRVLIYFAGFASIAWLIIAIRAFLQQSGEDLNLWASAIAPLLLSIAWMYGALKPAIRPPRTVQFDLFAIYIVQTVAGLLRLGGVLYELAVRKGDPERLIIPASNLAISLVLLVTVMSLPFAVPSVAISEKVGVSVTREDYTNLIGWVSFSWIYPLIRKGTVDDLNSDDVWAISPTMMAHVCSIKFREFKGSLLWRIIGANSLDILMDITGTITSVFLNYLSPFFMRQILSLIDTPHITPEARSNAYIYAALALFVGVLKAQVDLQRLWFARRAATRIKATLLSAVYEKALKRRDYSGLVDADKVKADALAKNLAADTSKTDAQKKSETEAAKAKAEEAKGGADIGKVTNLFSVDVGTIERTTAMMTIIYGAPTEMLVCGIFLYNLLGISAFAGLLVVVPLWPLNSFVTHRVTRLRKALLSARDKRVSTVNEVITAIKLIKFFAWENRWIKKTMDARETEIQANIRTQINFIFLGIVWNCIPLLVGGISFAVYVVQGNVLDVSTAFTAVALFNMVAQPMTTVTFAIMRMAEARVTLTRLQTFLDEDEVDGQVSSLKPAPPIVQESLQKGLGFHHASFKWNEVTEQEATESKKSDESSPVGSESTLLPTASTSSDQTEVASLLQSDSDTRKFELTDLTVIFPEGKLSIVTGPTASGKTAILLALLGEMTLLPGEGLLYMAKDFSQVDEHGFSHTISYSAQTPWLRNQSIKDNIVFGYPFDEKRYNDVIEACALKPDFAVLDDGDMTEIGARGVSLSGGQKARVALARATYARTKYVLLDDPLSAVDSHTAKFLVEKLLAGPLLANRTVILVTHHVKLVLPFANYMIRLLDGRIDSQGSIKDLRDKGDLEGLVADANEELKEEPTPVASDDQVIAEATPDAPPPADAKKSPAKLVEDEKREVGSVKWNVYLKYLRASSLYIWAVVVVLIVVGEGFNVGIKVWMKIWGEAYNDEETTQSLFSVSRFFLQTDAHASFHFSSVPSFNTNATVSALPSARQHPLFYVAIYLAIGFGDVIMAMLQNILLIYGGILASRSLFSDLLTGVTRATMRWHDITPQGRMLHRFGKDIETVDQSLSESMQAVNGSLAKFLAAVLTVAFFFPQFLIPAFFISLAYRHLGVAYLNTGRDLRRLEATSRSPIFSDFQELLEGIVSVRAYSSEKRFLDSIYEKVDLTNKFYYATWMSNRWLLNAYDCLGAVAIFFTTLFALSGYVSAGVAGLCITSAMSFTMSIYWACRFWTQLELDLNSVERVVEYLNLTPEPPLLIESNRPPAYWPSSTDNDSLVVAEDLSIRYAPQLPDIIKNISFSLKAQERVGLLGRTGSGKSTLAMSMLRFTDPSNGRILIDGIDITKIGLHDLRSRLTYIPQDAVLFSGTIRDNLDPFNEHTDQECLDVLGRVQLISNSVSTSRAESRAASIHSGDEVETGSSTAETVVEDSKIKITLETPVSAGGTNFSQGQRQLLSIARALLRRSAVVILDEATSSIDFKTDAKIQEVIRSEFNDALLLTIAHRLRTIIDYDRLLILDKGEIAEFDTPLNLIKKEGSIFRSMCLNSGTFKELEDAAQAKADELAQSKSV